MGVLFLFLNTFLFIYYCNSTYSNFSFINLIGFGGIGVVNSAALDQSEFNMKHIQESLPAQGKPKFICRIWRDGGMVFYRTFEYDAQNKEQQRIVAQKTVRAFLTDRNEAHTLLKGSNFRKFRTSTSARSKYDQVGVFRSMGSKRRSPSYSGHISYDKLHIAISYSEKFFSEPLAYELAVKTAKMLRVYFSIKDDSDEHVEKLWEYQSFKAARKNFRKMETKQQAIEEIVDKLEELIAYCDERRSNDVKSREKSTID